MRALALAFALIASPALASGDCVEGTDSFYESPACYGLHAIGAPVGYQGEPARIAAKSSHGRVAILTASGAWIVFNVSPEAWEGKLEDE
ncbi:hypothetical protein [Microvirga brassicacearum]|uniref:Uncharacterized protein n=1 Tax=Microvirga brassicacearum TaxID=2580413 RepID=A0A5N3PH57_9HYPH|nr:hypothetical protein [Microvirga brassicacearum]KAB0269048.1 hypothetical protein FEZ63_02770 [Microvirga brassicacearum]